MADIITSSEIQKAKQPLAKAWTLPPAAYTSAEVYQLEKENIFQRDWMCVARVEQVKNQGDFVCFDWFDQPIVVVRTQTDEIKALSSVCVHRAMPVVEGQGNTNRFVCPYHKWTYELDGSLRSAPMMQGVEDFETKDCRLPELKCEVWLGFIFVSLNPDADALGPQLKELADDLSIHHFEDKEIVDTIEFDSPWNWKLLVENFMEAYHHTGPHANTLEPIYPARESFTEGGALWSLLRMPVKDTGPDYPEQPEETELLAGVVFPMFLFAASTHNGIWYQLEPNGHDGMNLRIHLLQNAEAYAQLNDEEKTVHREITRTVHLEDIGVNQGPWKGLHAPMAKQGRLSLFEESIWQLNQFWLQRLEDSLAS